MREVEDHLAKVFNLTEEEIAQRYEVSGDSIFKNRVSWARTYLLKAKLIDAPRRGYVIITDRGRDVLAQNLTRLDCKFLEKYPEFFPFTTGANPRDQQLTAVTRFERQKKRYLKIWIS